MSKVMLSLIPILIINIIILTHELGHVFAAYWFNISIKQLSLGFGPSLFSINMAENFIFHLRAIPLGAFVELDNNLFNNPSWLVVIISAMGPIFNFLLGLAISYILIHQRIKNGSFFSDSNEEIYYRINQTNQLFKYSYETKKFSLLAESDYLLFPYPIKFSYFIFFWLPKKINILNIYFSHPAIVQYEKQTKKGLQGPISIFKEMKKYSDIGWEWGLISAANVSFSLGFFNLLPFIFLDGGKIALHSIAIVLGLSLFEADKVLIIFFTLLSLVFLSRYVINKARK